jgi:hypothetical protein
MGQIQHDRSAEHYARCERLRLPHETLLDAMTRLAIMDALECCPFQKDAAALLGLSRRMMTYYVQKFRIRRRFSRQSLATPISPYEPRYAVEEDVA